MQDEHFLRTGFFASVFCQDLNVFGAYLHGNDSLQPFDPESATLLGDDRAELPRLVHAGRLRVLPVAAGGVPLRDPDARRPQRPEPPVPASST